MPPRLTFDQFHPRVVSIVAKRIQYGSLITYGEVIGKILSQTGKRYHSNCRWLADSLTLMVQQDIAEGKPTRSAAVVLEGTNRPSRRYFDVCLELGAIKSDERKETFWRRNARSLGVRFF